MSFKKCVIFVLLEQKGFFSEHVLNGELKAWSQCMETDERVKDQSYHVISKQPHYIPEVYNQTGHLSMSVSPLSNTINLMETNPLP